jgi:hypothetical protein
MDTYAPHKEIDTALRVIKTSLKKKFYMLYKHNIKVYSSQLNYFSYANKYSLQKNTLQVTSGNRPPEIPTNKREVYVKSNTEEGECDTVSSDQLPQDRF